MKHLRKVAMTLGIVVSFALPGLSQTVTVVNPATDPALVRDVDNGKNPFRVRLALNNLTPPGPGCSVGQCQASFNVPTGKRFVVENISVRVQGSTGQRYLAMVAGSGLAEYLVLNFQGAFQAVDVLTANQPTRVYLDDIALTGLPPVFSVTSTDGRGFFADVNISGYLIER